MTNAERMMFALGIIIIGICLAGIVAAEPVCLPRDQLIPQLTGQYAETRLGLGMTANGHVIEIYTGTNGSWSLVVTRADGVACLVEAGANWQADIPGDPA